MNRFSCSLRNILLIGDSHAKNLPLQTTTLKYSITTKFIRGLKFFDQYNSALCLYTLISTREFQIHLSQIDTLILLIGTNSIRNINASSVIHQVQDIINVLRKWFPHFHKPQSISICLIFPCLKVSNRFFTTFSLQSNIDTYNEQLIYLSEQMHFNILDLKITKSHLARDHMHIDYYFEHLILDAMIDHVNHLIELPSTSTKTYLKSEIRAISNL